MSEPTKAEVTAAVRGVLGTHTQAQDSGRTDDVVALYAEDAVLEMPGEGPIEGREAIRKAFTGWEPQLPQLHLVSNTVVTSTSADEARALSDVAFLLRTDAGWSVQIVGHYDDTLRLHDGEWLIQRRAATFQA
jgi:ketosteroid isomerase-like protein